MGRKKDSFMSNTINMKLEEERKTDKPKVVDRSVKNNYNNQMPEEKFKKKRGGHAFWDTPSQKTKARWYANTHGLDFKNPEVKLAIREMYRLKEAKFKGNIARGEPLRNFVKDKDELLKITSTRRLNTKALKETIKSVIDLRTEDEIKEENTKELMKDAKIMQGRYQRSGSQQLQKKETDGLPSMTSRVWKGEHFNEETGEWSIIQEGARNDYFAWYLEFIFPMRKNSIPLGKIHEDWCDELDSDDRVMMFKPRDHYKTTIISIGYAVYELCEFKHNLWPVLIVSKADLNTRDTMQGIRQHLEKNDRILSFYGYIINEDLANDKNGLFTLYQDIGDKDPALYCSTFGANLIMGTHPHLAILDDIEVKALSPALMYQAKTLLDKSLLAAMPKGSKLILVGTLKGYDQTNDIYLYAKAKGIFSVYEDPAVYKINPETQEPILDDKGNKIYGIVDMKYVKWYKEKRPQYDDQGKVVTTWKGNIKYKWEIIVEVEDDQDKNWRSIYPERYTVIDIIKKRIEVREVDKQNDDTFWSEYFLRPCKPGGNFFNSERMKLFPPKGHATTMSYLEWISAMQIPTVAWIDPGGKKSHGIAIACMCFWKNEKHLINLKVVRNGILGAAKLIAEWKDKYCLQLVGCESNFDQKETFAETIERELEAYCNKSHLENCFIHITPIPNKGDKILRIETQMKVIMGFEGEESEFYVNQDADDYEQFCNEVINFPNITPGAEHEWDLMDSTASCKIHLSELATMCDEIFAYS